MFVNHAGPKLGEDIVNVNPFKPVPNPRYFKDCLWSDRWYRGTGMKPSEDMSDMVKNRFKKPCVTRRHKGGLVNRRRVD